MYKILVIDDEIENSNLIESYGQHLGHKVTSINDPKQVLKHLSENNYNIILLDIMMPDISGLQLFGEIKKVTDAKIFFLSALGEASDRINGLKLGSNDYITKPFSLEELFLRIDNCLQTTSSSTKEVINGLSFDVHHLTVIIDGEELKLTSTLFKLLYELVTHKNQILTREHLLKTVWNDSGNEYRRTVDTHILKLRNKLGKNSYKIVTVVGEGYTYED